MIFIIKKIKKIIFYKFVKCAIVEGSSNFVGWTHPFSLFKAC